MERVHDPGLLAPGFEEIEALTTVDILRRAGLETVTVAIGTPGRAVEGAHGITVTADIKRTMRKAFRLKRWFCPGDAGHTESGEIRRRWAMY